MAFSYSSFSSRGDFLDVLDYFTREFLLSALSVVLIDIVLSGDNSVVIAMAVHSLAPSQRRKAILIGTGGAVSLRVIFTLFAARLLTTPFVKLVGGGLILWIAVKLLIDEGERAEHLKKPETLWTALWVIMVADFSMSLDNVLAVAGVSHGDTFMIWFGLALSIPLVIFASTILSTLMNRYPLILYIGAALLGKVGGEMIVTDPYVVGRTGIHEEWMIRSVEGLCMVAVLLIAWLIVRRKKLAAEPAPL